MIYTVDDLRQIKDRLCKAGDFRAPFVSLKSLTKETIVKDGREIVTHQLVMDFVDYWLDVIYYSKSTLEGRSLDLFEDIANTDLVHGFTYGLELLGEAIINLMSEDEMRQVEEKIHEVLDQQRTNHRPSWNNLLVEISDIRFRSRSNDR